MSMPTSSHAYGIGVLALIVGMSAVLVFYTSFYLPESLAKPFVPESILNPKSELIIEIVPGAVTEGNDSYVPNSPTAILEDTNKVVWKNNDDTAHTVTPNKPHSDSYSGEFGTTSVLKPGDTYEFLFTVPQEFGYHCTPHPWMKGSIIVEKGRFH